MSCPIAALGFEGLLCTSAWGKHSASDIENNFEVLEVFVRRYPQKIPSQYEIAEVFRDLDVLCKDHLFRAIDVEDVSNKALDLAVLCKLLL